jgi:hypothetical protein
VYLKSKNAPYLWLFTGLNVTIFISVTVGRQLTYSSVERIWQWVATKDGLIAICVPLATIVMNGLLGDVAKARLVFWRWLNPLPGCRAFSELMSTDPRIDAGLLKAKYAPIPQDPIEQNSLWYGLYKVHSKVVTVSEAHKLYLLTRDMTALSVLFAVMFPVSVLYVSVEAKRALLYCGILFTQYLLLSMSARNYGNRFVLNVLAVASHAE